MRNKIGVLCMLLGAVLVLGALALFLYNQQETQEAEIFAENLIPVLREEITLALQTESAELVVPENTPVELLRPEDLVMTEKNINGNAYIGYLAIPELNLELPVMSDWDTRKLQISPCRYTGTVRGENLVIMAHNYSTHFGKLSKLSDGSEIVFMDMDGGAWKYQVAEIEVLAPTAVEEMVSTDYALSLFTCTPGGSSRVTVRCDIVDHY